MRGLRAFSAVVIAAACAAAVPAFAQPVNPNPKTLAERSAFWKQIQKSCNETAALTPLPLAQAIGALAKTEHARWAGHRIDHQGRLYVFGLVESENEEMARADATMHDVGWWNVWRYWSHLDGSQSERAIPSYLSVAGISGAIAESDPDKPIRERSTRSTAAAAGATTRFSIETKALLAAVDLISNEQLATLLRSGDFTETSQRLAGTHPSLGKLDYADLRQAIKQSVLRAFISDNAWSAAFISYVVDTARNGHSDDQFRSGVAHRDYIRQAIEASKAEVTGKPASALYRACSIHGTTPRVGDLICYHREIACSGVNPKEVRDFVAFGTPVASRPNCKRISLTHCDVVTEARLDQHKVYSIGGNVQQSVTERRLEVFKKPNGEFVFHREQGRASCDFVGPDEQGRGDAGEKRCSLNNKDWYVLLQMRHPKPDVAQAKP